MTELNDDERDFLRWLLDLHLGTEDEFQSEYYETVPAAKHIRLCSGIRSKMELYGTHKRDNVA